MSHELERFFSVEYELDGKTRYFSFRCDPKDKESIAEVLMKEKPGATFVCIHAGIKENATAPVAPES